MKNLNTEIVSEIENQNSKLDSNNYDLIELKELILKINSLTVKDYRKFENNISDFQDKLFNKGISFPENFQDKRDEKKDKSSSKKKTIENIEENDFDDKLRELLSCIGNDLSIFRRYLILKLGDCNKANEILLLHDKHSKSQVLEKIKTHFYNNCKIFELDEFLDELKFNNANYSEKNIICLIVFSYSPNFESIESFIDDLNGYLTPLVQIKIYKTKNGHDYKENKDYESIKDEIRFSIGIDIIDMDISSEEEEILKKLFKDISCHVLEYKKINDGFSGSKVFRIIPHKIKGGIPVKYIVKVCLANSSKLTDEEKNFRNNVDGYDNRYSIQSERTERLCAIKYNFASDDGISNSQSFSEMIKTEKDSSILKNVVYELYEIKLFTDWHVSRIEKKKVLDFYEGYINISKIYEAIKKILNLTDSELMSLDLIKNAETIFEKEAEFRVKICHGDLHSGNFFVDDNNKIFLIDFGDTGDKHALIDFTALECSIKFRHIPFYISLDHLLKIEENLTDEDSFNNNFIHSSINREDLIKYFDLINIIRNKSKNYFLHDYKEYLISLFLMTFRQIQYPDLNQIYALKSAEVLSQKILDQIP